MNIAVIGYGKMGKAIEKLAIERGHSVVVKIDQNNPEELLTLKEKGVDVAIEFTGPQYAYDNIVACFKQGVAVVCGTTGWLSRKSEVESLCKELDGAFFYASNYSIGVNLFFELNRKLASIIEGFNQYDLSVEEVHHNQKLDAPSGTAISIAEDIISHNKNKKEWILGSSTMPDVVGITAVRRSDVPGIHSVTWESEIDLITIEHKAKSRTGFALGAVVASEFLKDKKGVFAMRDMLTL